MARLTSFISISLDGCISDAAGDVNAFHHHDPEYQTFVQDNAKGGGRLVFGRRTYDMMASYWPTPAALQQSPVVASQMNAMQKVVFSRTMDEADWNNTTLVKRDIAAEVKKLKADGGPDMATLGSGSIITQLSEAGLIDELQVVLNPIAVGGGRKLFDGVGRPLAWKLAKTRRFGNGCVFLGYEPA